MPVLFLQLRELTHATIAHPPDQPRPDFSRIYGLALQHACHDVLVLDQPDDAVDQAPVDPPNLVLVEFPTATSVGRTVAETLRDDARTAAFPVVAITAPGTRPELAEAHGCGASVY